MERSNFSIWLEAELGTRAWVVAARLTAGLKAHGHEIAVSRKRFADLRQQYLASVAA